MHTTTTYTRYRHTSPELMTENVCKVVEVFKIEFSIQYLQPTYMKYEYTYRIRLECIAVC